MDIKTIIGQKRKLIAVAFLALFMMSVGSALVMAGTATSTVTVTKDSVPIEGAFVNVFKCEKAWYGLYYVTGDPVATNITDANGVCTFTLDPALLYQFQVNNGGDAYQVNALGLSTIAIQLGYTANARANAMPWIIGALIAIIGLVFLGYIKFTNKGPFQVKA